MLQEIFVSLISGASASVLFDLWRGRGRVHISKRYVWKRGSSSWADIESYVCEFSLRAANSFLIQKTITVCAVDFYGQNRDRPLFTDPNPKIGFGMSDARDQDIDLPPTSISRIRVCAYTPCTKDTPVSRDDLLSLESVRIRFTVLPSTRIDCWYDLSDAIDLEDPKNSELIQSKLLRG